MQNIEAVVNMGKLGKSLQLILIFITAMGYSLAMAQESVPRFEPGDCPFESQSPLEGVDCGELVVYENREEPEEGTLRLAVAILRSLSDKPAPDPLVFLSGGPGGPSVTFTPSRASSDFWNRYRQRRDIVFFDQRGTGYSEPTFCEELNLIFRTVLYRGLNSREIRDHKVAATQDCFDKMQAKGVDFSAYNTATSAKDLDELRQALGYAQWNLFGISYGTLLALTTMRDHPDGIRSIILDSTLPPNVRRTVNRPSNFNRSLRLVFDQCAADSACRDAYPRLESDFYAILDSLKHQPIVLAMEDTTRFPGGRLVLNDALLLGGIFQGLYNRNFIPLFPLLVQQTKAGNVDVWKGLARQLAVDPQQTSQGLQKSIRCYENVPFNPPELVDSARAQYPRIAPFFETFFHLHAVCDAWHNVRADSLEFRPVRSTLPTLIYGGEFDPTTQPYYGQIAAKTLSNSTFVKAPALGHVVAPFTTCTQDLMSTFLETPSQPLDTSCVEDLPSVSFITDAYINSGVYALAQQINRGPGLPLVTSLGLMGLLLLSGLITWPIRYILRYLRGNLPESKVSQKTALWIAAAASLSGLAFLGGLGFGIQSTAEANPFLLAFGLIGSYSWISLIPWILTILTFVVITFSIWAWRNKWWTTLLRTHYTLVAVTCIGVIAFISYWELW